MRALSIALLLVSCAHRRSVEPEIPPPNVTIPATDGDARACQRLYELGCSEAMAGCLAVFTAARTDGVVIPPCLATAKTVADVRACGDASTLTVECR
jgi:hypothetical protein